MTESIRNKLSLHPFCHVYRKKLDKVLARLWRKVVELYIVKEKSSVEEERIVQSLS